MEELRKEERRIGFESRLVFYGETGAAVWTFRTVCIP